MGSCMHESTNVSRNYAVSSKNKEGQRATFHRTSPSYLAATQPQSGHDEDEVVVLGEFN